MLDFQQSAGIARKRAMLTVAAGLIAWRWGAAAERKPLEMVARPLTFIDID